MPSNRKNKSKEQIVISDSEYSSSISQSMPRKRVKRDQPDQEDLNIIKFEAKKQNTEDTQKNKLTLNMITPWIQNRTLEISDSLLRFHNEIIDFYNYIKPSQSEHNQKMDAFHEIKDLIIQMFPLVEVMPFGSFATKLYLPDGDVDIAVLTGGNYQITTVYNRIHKKLTTDPHLYTDLQYIRKSKVPLIKFVCGNTGVQFDISVDKADGVHQIQYVRRTRKAYPEFKYLVLVFKCFLKVRGLGDTYTGGVGSFLLYCMLLMYLQDIHRAKKYYTLGQHVIKFMHFYGQTDWSRKVVYVKNATIGTRQRFDDYCTFSCLSPQDEAHDVGRSAFKIKDVFNVFRNRGRYIGGKNFQKDESVLKQLLNPNKDKFKYYR